jgi:hypothetical protein
MGTSPRSGWAAPVGIAPVIREDLASASKVIL